MQSLQRLNCILAIALSFSLRALASAADQPAPADPITATIHTEDAERFARIFEAAKGNPSAEQLQKGYLDGGSYGIKVFTPNRIVNAEHLAAAVSKNSAAYEHAIRVCLPRLNQYDADLRSIYLAMHGLFPDKPLPQIFIVFGAASSGGTAGPNAQVLGLEVLCATSDDTPDGLRTTLRRFFAHETVHTFQSVPTDASKSPLLASALIEGGADFIASIVTGQIPDPQRANWAGAREADLWAQFQKDMQADQMPTSTESPRAANQARLRWIGNYKAAPPGWPVEAGYWIGMRIWQCYYEAAPDKHKAIRDVLDWNDPGLILRESRYSGHSCDAEGAGAGESRTRE